MAGLGLEFFGALLSGGDIGGALLDELGGEDKIFGTKPKVAPYKPIDLGDEIGKAVSDNLENLPDITALLDKIIPNFSSLLEAGTDSALALSRGELPQATKDAIQRNSAYKALQGGFAGTPTGQALSLRDLGIGTIEGMAAGANLATQWTNLAEGAFSPFIVSTGQEAGTTAANNAGIQAMKQFQFNVAAAPDPGAYGHFLLDQHIGDQFMSFGLGAAGGAIAGAGSAPAAAPVAQATPAYPYGYQPYNNWQSAPTWSNTGGGA